MVIRYFSCIFSVLIGVIFAFPPFYQIFSLPEISSPASGDILQGQVSVMGNADVDGFISYEVSFTYEEDGADNWFLVTYSSETVSNDVLAVWDTTVITDGNYKLRLIVEQDEGRSYEEIVDNLRVRNYSLVETETPVIGETPQATQLSITQAPAATLTVSAPTDFPENPAEIHTQELQNGIILGAGAAATLFILFFIYHMLKKNGRR